MHDRTMNALKEGESAYVFALKTKGAMRRRLYDIGLVPGTRVQCLQKSIFGDPVAFLIRGAVIALRNRDSVEILIKPA